MPASGTTSLAQVQGFVFQLHFLFCVHHEHLRSEDNSQELVFFYHVDCEDWIQVTRLWADPPSTQSSEVWVFCVLDVKFGSL